MKKIIQTKLFLFGLLLLIIIGWYSQFRKENQYEKYRCKTKLIKLKSVIKGVNTKANYMQVAASDSKEWISLNIAKTKYKKGFSESYYYQVGDSIIKEANSKEFIIKRDTCMAVYILDCDD